MNRLDAIEACNRALVMEPAIIGTRAAGVYRQRTDRECPVHNSNECVETFYASSALARLSLLEMWTLWRSWRREIRR